MANTIDDLRTKAQQSLAQGQYQQAHQFYHQALGLHGDNPDVHYGLATVCFLLNDLHGAAYHFMEVTRLDPLRAGAFVNLGAVYNRMEKYDDAINVLRRGIQIDPGKAEGYYNLGVVYRQLGQLDMAIQAYREATRINARMPDAHYNIANIYLEKEQYGMAIAHYRNALELRPKWEKAERGLAAAEQAVNPSAGAKPEPPKSGVQPPSAAKARLDPDRLVDPNVHGEQLRDVHQLIVEMNNHGQKLLTVLEEDIERAIRDLSNCLLFPNNPGNDLHGQIQKFDVVMTQLQQLHQSLQKRMQKTKELGEEISQL